jgi:hypothetical protein
MALCVKFPGLFVRSGGQVTAGRVFAGHGNLIQDSKLNFF